MSRNRELSYQDAFLKLQLKYQYILDDNDVDEEEKYNFERYVMPALAEATQKPRPGGDTSYFKCLFPMCGGALLKTKATLMRHIRIIHSDLLPLRGAFLLSPSSSNHDGRRFHCLECDKQFIRHDHLHQHLSSNINARCAARYKESRETEKTTSTIKTERIYNDASDDESCITSLQPLAQSSPLSRPLFQALSPAHSPPQSPPNRHSRASSASPSPPPSPNTSKSFPMMNKDITNAEESTRKADDTLLVKEEDKEAEPQLSQKLNNAKNLRKMNRTLSNLKLSQEPCDEKKRNETLSEIEHDHE